MLAMFGLATGAFLLAFIGISGVSVCYQTLVLVRNGYLEEETGPDYSASAWDEPPKRRKNTEVAQAETPAAPAPHGAAASAHPAPAHSASAKATPEPAGADYVTVCVPAFTRALVHRDA